MTNTNTNTTLAFEGLKNADKLRFIAQAVTQLDNGSEMAEFLEAQAQSFDKKNAQRRSKPSKAQQENDATREEVKELFARLAVGTTLTGDEIATVLGLDFSAQKTTAMLKPLLTQGFEKVEGLKVETQDLEGNVKKARKVGYKLA